jgi:hypothetical protein
MRCGRCKSLNVVKFIDGFGDHRIFCRCCGRSFLEDSFARLGSQSSLVEFDNKMYFRPQALRFKVGGRY